MKLKSSEVELLLLKSLDMQFWVKKEGYENREESCRSLLHADTYIYSIMFSRDIRTRNTSKYAKATKLI